jgi:hypothetical protein
MSQTIGTRRFWKPLPGITKPEDEQILKLQGYINIVLQAVHYRADGNFWQNIFGGSDRITLTSYLTYQSGNDSISTAAIQDVRKVKVDASHYLAIGRSVALKVPASADGLELRVEISAIEDDNLEAALTLLNSDEYRGPLQLAPPVVGQILAISSLVKKLFSHAGVKKRLEATYPAIISQEKTPQPIENNRLMKGHLILVYEADDYEKILNNLDVSRLDVSGDKLKYNNTPMQNTYIVYNVSADSVRGLNPAAGWYKKFQNASNKLDEIDTSPESKWQDIFNQSLGLWSQASAMLDEDATYIPDEQRLIKKERLNEIRKIYKEKTEAITGPTASGVMESQKIGSILPETIAFSTDFAEEPIRNLAIGAQEYLNNLRSVGLSLNWNK